MSSIQDAPTIFVVDGLPVADMDRWPAHIGVTDELLAYADPSIVTSGDGFVRFTVGGESVLYGIAHPHPSPDPCGEKINHYDRLDR